MSEHIAVEPRTDGESKPSERSCCGITNCGDRFHRRLEHWTDRRFNVRPKHNAESDHSPDDSDTTDAGDHTNIANAGNHTDITDTRINTNIAGSGNNKSS